MKKIKAIPLFILIMGVFYLLLGIWLALKGVIIISCLLILFGAIRLIAE